MCCIGGIALWITTLANVWDERSMYDAASLKRYEASAPVNYRVIFISTALLAGCSFVVGETFKRFKIVKGDFDLVNRLSDSEVVPCGLAIPRMRFIMQSLQHIGDDPFSEHTDATLALMGKQSFCEAETAVNAIRVAFQQPGITPLYDNELTIEREASNVNVRDFVCKCTRGRCGGGDHGDALRNLNHSYVLAAPAFVKYAENLGSTDLTNPHCMGDATTNPFGSARCQQSSFVNNELTEAALNTPELLNGVVDVEKLPDVSEMLYRLTALAVLEYYDRTENGGKCFSNTNKFNATFLCDSIISSKATEVVPTTAITRASQHTYYKNILLDERTTCDGPEAPIIRNRTFGKDYGHLKPAIAICASTLEYGLLDIKRLYGIPDPVGEFEFASGHFGNSFTRWLAGVAYYGLYFNNANKIVADWHTARIHLKLYLGYRLAATAAWAFAAVLACGYVLAYAATPLIKLLYKRIAQRFLLPAAQVSTITLKPLGAAEFACTGAAVVAGLWLLFVDPAAHSPYFYASTCTDYATHGGTFPSIAKRRPVGVVAATLTAMPALLVIHLLIFRKKPKNTRIMPLAPFPVYPVVVLIVLVLAFLVILCVDAGNEWWSYAKISALGESPGALESFERIIDTALIVLLALGALLGILNQRSLAANSAMNVPAGRVPIFAALWCGAAFAASTVATAFSFKFVDCSIKHGIDDIICGDSSTFLTRFLGVVIFTLCGSTIFIVFFASFKLLYEVPRSTDARDATFGLTKRQKLEQLNAQNAAAQIYPDAAAGRFDRLRGAFAGGAGRVAGGAGRVADGVKERAAKGAAAARSVRFGASAVSDDNDVISACFIHTGVEEKLPLV